LPTPPFCEATARTRVMVYAFCVQRCNDVDSVYT
jgi:hypothetical protein